MEPMLSIVKEIWDFEGFCIRFRHPHKISEMDLEMYNPGIWVNQYPRTHTVRNWINVRFNKRYNDVEIYVLDGYGNIVDNRTHLGTVRETYNTYQIDEDTNDYE